MKRFEAYPAEDVEMDLAGTGVHDDDFHEEHQLEEPRVLKEVPNAVRLAVMRIQKNLGHPSKELLCRAVLCGSVEPIRLRSRLRVNSNVMRAWKQNRQKVTCLRSSQMHTLNSIKELEWVSLC